jgi:hypothetical protein
MSAAEFSTDSERDALCGFLDKQRDALIRKVAGVSEEGPGADPVHTPRPSPAAPFDSAEGLTASSRSNTQH